MLPEARSSSRMDRMRPSPSYPRERAVRARCCSATASSSLGPAAPAEQLIEAPGRDHSALPWFQPVAIVAGKPLGVNPAGARNCLTAANLADLRIFIIRVVQNCTVQFCFSVGQRNAVHASGVYASFQATIPVKAQARPCCDLAENCRPRAVFKIAGYGAPAKGNTLLYYFKIGPDTLAVRRSQSAQAARPCLEFSSRDTATTEGLGSGRRAVFLSLPAAVLVG